MAGKLWALRSKALSNASRYYFRQTRGVQTLVNSTSDDSKNWICSKFEIPTVKDLTLPEFFRETCGNWGDALAFECIETGRKLTHNQVSAQGRGFAAALIQSGFKRGDVIGVVLNNIPEYCSVLLGIWDAGLIASTVNPSYTSAEIKRQLESSGAKGIVTAPLYLKACRESKASNPNIRSLIIIGEPHEGCHSYYEMAKTDASSVQFLRGKDIDTLNETAVLPYSSGTTGPPKGVMLTHSNIATNLLQSMDSSHTTIRGFENGHSQERFFGLLPFFHAYGLVCLVLTSFQKGLHLITLPRFETGLFLKAIRHHKPTVLHTVTPILSYIVNSDDYSPKEFEPINVIIGGAAPVGATLINQVLDKAKKNIIYQEGYGMTELSPVSHFLPHWTNNQKHGSCGTPIPSTLTKIADVTTGVALPRGQSGEICVKGPQVMKGYFNNEEATRNTIDQEGWLHTGDIGYYDDDNCLFIVDRIKELIKVKGMQVSPSELEDLLRDIQKIEDVAVIGIPNAEWGEVPRAYVVPKKGVKLAVDEVHAHLKDQVISYKQLKGGVEFVKEIPKAPSGKILRRELLQEYKDKHGIK